MNLEPIRRRLSGGGFQPFALRTSDSREYAVRHPEMVLISGETVETVSPYPKRAHTPLKRG
jgi:hypothetical protein